MADRDIWVRASYKIAFPAPITELIIYMKKFLHFDWLRAVQFFSKTVQKRVNSVQKEETTQAFQLVNYNNNEWYLPRKLHSPESGFQGGPASDRNGIN